MTMGNSKNSRQKLKSRKFDAREIYMFYTMLCADGQQSNASGAAAEAVDRPGSSAVGEWSRLSLWDASRSVRERKDRGEFITLL